MLEGDVWLGVHNMFLMLLGEAGPLRRSISLSSMSLAIDVSGVSLQGMLVGPILLGVQLADMMASHTYLGARYQNIVLALLFGMIASVALKSTMPRIAGAIHGYQYQSQALRPRAMHTRS